MERGIRRLETVRRHAPFDRDELFGELGGFTCGSLVECRYKKQRQDVHHLIYGAELTPVQELLRRHKDFQTLICRCGHDAIHHTWRQSDIPSDSFALRYLSDNPDGLSAGNQQRLEEIKKHA